MSDDFSPVLVRMENELKAALQHSSKLHGRTLTGEINTRLRNSFDLEKGGTAGVAPASAKKQHKYPAGQAPTVVHINNLPPEPGHQISELDRTMLDVFHALPVEKQLALLSLFK